jgi:hypothetical protein
LLRLHLHLSRVLPALPVLLVLICVPFVHGQSRDDHTAVEAVPNTPAWLVTKNEFGIWTGYSPFSFVLKGTSKDRQLFLLNLQYARTLLSRRPLRLKYTAEAVPVAVEFQPTQRYLVNGKVVVNRSAAVYGAGANPVGLQANLGSKTVQPFIQGTLGFLYFRRQVPVIGSAQFNYAISVGFGVQVYARRGRSLSFGWRYHHLSNDNEAQLNPGIDSGVFYVGYSMPGRRGE